MQVLFFLLCRDTLNMKTTQKIYYIFFCLIYLIAFFHEVLAVKVYRWSVLVCRVLYRRITDFHYLENRETKVQK